MLHRLFIVSEINILAIFSWKPFVHLANRSYISFSCDKNKRWIAQFALIKDAQPFEWILFGISTLITNESKAYWIAVILYCAMLQSCLDHFYFPILKVGLIIRMWHFEFHILYFFQAFVSNFGKQCYNGSIHVNIFAFFF